MIVPAIPLGYTTPPPGVGIPYGATNPATQPYTMPTLRWDTAHWPITVYIPPAPPILGLSQQDCVHALNTWQAYCSSSPLVTLADRPAQAAIQLQWHPLPPTAHPNMCGHTQIQVSAHTGHIVGANLTIITNAAIDQRLTIPQRQQRIRATLGHEMGHALGLRHSVDTQSLMHPQQGWRFTTPSAQDILQCQRLYGHR